MSNALKLTEQEKNRWNSFWKDINKNKKSKIKKSRGGKKKRKSQSRRKSRKRRH